MGSRVNFEEMKQNSEKEQMDLQRFIGTSLRWGVSIACIIAVIGGVCYLMQHGNDPVPDYSTFRRDPSSHITWLEIWQGVVNLQAEGLILLGVILLIFTPIFRVALSLITFSLERDWLYVAITALVFLIIISNMLEGVGG